MLGKTFSRLTVIGPAKRNTDGHAAWLCSCECGNPDPVVVVGNNLRRGSTKSCGCLVREHSSRMGRLSKGRLRPHPLRERIQTLFDSGKTVREIAEELGLHIATVYKNRAAICRAEEVTLSLLRSLFGTDRFGKPPTNDMAGICDAPNRTVELAV